MYNKIRANADIVLKPALTQLDDLERAVDSPDFFRCHRSFLVNLGHVERIESSDFLMSDGARIPISSANLPRARNAFLDWVYLRAWESK